MLFYFVQRLKKFGRHLCLGMMFFPYDLYWRFHNRWKRSETKSHPNQSVIILLLFISFEIIRSLSIKSLTVINSFFARSEFFRISTPHVFYRKYNAFILIVIHIAKNKSEICKYLVKLLCNKGIIADYKVIFYQRVIFSKLFYQICNKTYPVRFTGSNAIIISVDFYAER